MQKLNTSPGFITVYDTHGIPHSAKILNSYGGKNMSSAWGQAVKILKNEKSSIVIVS